MDGKCSLKESSGGGKDDLGFGSLWPCRQCPSYKDSCVAPTDYLEMVSYPLVLTNWDFYSSDQYNPMALPRGVQLLVMSQMQTGHCFDITVSRQLRQVLCFL